VADPGFACEACSVAFAADEVESRHRPECGGFEVDASGGGGLGDDVGDAVLDGVAGQPGGHPGAGLGGDRRADLRRDRSTGTAGQAHDRPGAEGAEGVTDGVDVALRDVLRQVDQRTRTHHGSWLRLQAKVCPPS